MAKHRSHRRRSHSKSRTMRRGQHGGSLAGNPPSAWGWGMGTLGNGWTQFMNSLTLQPGQNLGTIQSNSIVPVGGVNAQDAQGMIGSNLKGDVPQSGGKKRRHHRSRAKRGGNILAAAALPVALIAMNNALGAHSRKRKNKH
jgi:hypothetical protein